MHMILLWIGYLLGIAISTIAVSTAGEYPPYAYLSGAFICGLIMLAYDIVRAIRRTPN